MDNISLDSAYSFIGRWLVVLVGQRMVGGWWVIVISILYFWVFGCRWLIKILKFNIGVGGRLSVVGGFGQSVNGP